MSFLINPFVFAGGGGAGVNSAAAYSRITQLRRELQIPTWASVTGASEVGPGVLTKTAANGWGNSGAVSREGFTRDCRFTYIWRAPFENAKMIGLSTEATCNTYATIDYGVNLQGASGSDHTVAQYQNSAAGGNLVAATDGITAFALVEIERIGRTVSLWLTSYPGGGKRVKFDFSVLPAVGAVLYVHLAMFNNGVVFDNRDMLWYEL